MRRILTFIVVTLLIACSQETPDTVAVEQKPVTDWRVLISLPENDLPVTLHLTPDGSEAWFYNGAEIVVVPEIIVDGNTRTLRFPTFNNTLHIEQTEAGLSGSLTLVKRGSEQVMDLTAEPDRGFRFTENAKPEMDVTGRWEVKFTEEEGKEYMAVAEFDQQGGTLTGTFLTALGDYRFLAGETDGKMMRLSTFDGAHAFVFTAEMQEDGTLKGDFWSGTKWHESWEAKRNFDASLPDAYELTYLKEGYDKLVFSFPNLDGESVSLDDPKYQNKVVLVTLAGTWCPNCADEMEFLSEYYSQEQGRGLEVITLLYEHFLDFETASALGREMVSKHQIDFEVLVAGSSDKEAAAETLPMLNRVLAFPTMIFIDRSGTVRKIHTGFSGPGTGQHYHDFKQAFTEYLEILLNE